MPVVLYLLSIAYYRPSLLTFSKYSFARCLSPFAFFPAYTACLACPFLAHLFVPVRFSPFFFYPCIFITLPHGLGCFPSIEDTR
jgi:hypothetical protein